MSAPAVYAHSAVAASITQPAAVTRPLMSATNPAHSYPRWFAENTRAFPHVRRSWVIRAAQASTRGRATPDDGWSAVVVASGSSARIFFGARCREAWPPLGVHRGPLRTRAFLAEDRQRIDSSQEPAFGDDHTPDDQAKRDGYRRREQNLEHHPTPSHNPACPAARFYPPRRRRIVTSGQFAPTAGERLLES
jgi:hypothetical protein